MTLQNARKILRASNTSGALSASVLAEAQALVDRSPAGRGATFVVASSSIIGTTRYLQADYQCDGVADEEQIQQAIDALNSTYGGVVVLTEGIFNIAGSINSGTRQDFVLEGASAPSAVTGGLTVLKVVNGANLAAIFTTGTTGTVKGGIHIRKMLLDGNKDNQASGTGTGIYVRVFRSSLTDVSVRNCYGAGIVMEGNSGANLGIENIVKNVRILNCANSGLVLSPFVADSHFEDIICGGNTPYNLSIGVSVSACLFSKCHLYGSSVSTYNAFLAGGGVRNIFLGCRFENAAQHGVVIDAELGALLDIIFGICRFATNGIAAANTYDDLLLTRTAGSNTIARTKVLGCSFSRITGSDTQQRYGVNVAGTYATDTSVQDNSFNTAHYATSEVNDAGLRTIVRNNPGFVTENKGNGTILNGTLSIAITHGCDYTPTAQDVAITPTELSTVETGTPYVDTFTATQFTVRVRTDPGASNLDFSWHVRK